mgnify:CR=1 FL=1
MIFEDEYWEHNLKSFWPQVIFSTPPQRENIHGTRQSHVYAHTFQYTRSDHTITHKNTDSKPHVSKWSGHHGSRDLVMKSAHVDDSKSSQRVRDLHQSHSAAKCLHPRDRTAVTVVQRQGDTRQGDTPSTGSRLQNELVHWHWWVLTRARMGFTSNGLHVEWAC